MIVNVQTQERHITVLPRSVTMPWKSHRNLFISSTYILIMYFHIQRVDKRAGGTLCFYLKVVDFLQQLSSCFLVLIKGFKGECVKDSSALTFPVSLLTVSWCPVLISSYLTEVTVHSVLIDDCLFEVLILIYT